MIRNLCLWALLWSAIQSLHAYDSIRMEQKNGILFIVHAVEPRETLYQLSKRYQSSVEAIQAENLDTDTLQIGQILYIPYRIQASSQTLSARPPSSEKPSDKKNTPKQPKHNTEDQLLEPTSSPSQWLSDSLFLQPYTFKHIKEEGVARALTTEKGLFALHRAAPIGTFVKVENQINKKRLLVRVIGRIPEVDQNQKTLIQLSPKTYRLLNSPDQWTRVTITYLSNSDL